MIPLPAGVQVLLPPSSRQSLEGDSMRCKVAFTYVYDDDGGLFEQKAEVIDLLETIPAHGSQAGFDVRRT